MPVAEVIAGRLEVERGVVNVVTHWPRRDGQSVVPSAASLVSILDPVGAAVAGSVPSASLDAESGAISFTWTPGTSLMLEEGYRFELTWTDAVGTVVESRFFDLVRRTLRCPVDQDALQAREPDLPGLLRNRTLASAQPFILAAWEQMVGRIRAAGLRPGLLTEPEVFRTTTIALSLSLVMRACMRAPDDVWDRKRALYTEEAESSWNAMGSLRYMDEVTGGDAGKTAPPLPRFWITPQYGEPDADDLA